mgnify:CR=1 FL=1
MLASAPSPETVLHEVFGFPSFRGHQAEIVADVCAGRDVLAVMPTGSGKSLCYQVPALVRPGCALVISPLIALMQDQVRALRSNGVRAAALNSQSLDSGATIAALENGELDLLYVAPERATLPGFQTLVARVEIALIAIATQTDIRAAIARPLTSAWRISSSRAASAGTRPWARWPSLS